MATNYREILRLAKLGVQSTEHCCQRRLCQKHGTASSGTGGIKSTHFGRAAGPVGQGNTTSFVSRVIYSFHAEAAGLRARPPGTGKKRRDSKLALE